VNNRIYLRYTKFIELDEKGEQVDVSCGYLLWDNYGTVVNKDFRPFWDLKTSVKLDNLLDVLKESHADYFSEVLCWGITFNGHFYKPEELPGYEKHLKG
jgi:hypothetical protein